MHAKSLDEELLPRIPLSARTVLDVGCGAGGLARAYRMLNPTARLLGIEIDPIAARSAAEHFDQITTADVEIDPLPFDVSAGIDCIVYNAILHRLRDPWALVRRHAEALSPDGVMLISLPNPDNWRIVDRLLRGTWQGEEPAVSFSAAAVRHHIAQAGLTICDVAQRDASDRAADDFFTAIEPALDALGVDPGAYAKRATATHLIWRVRKQPVQRMIVSGTMLDPVGGVSHVRVVHPLLAVASDPGVLTEVTATIDTRPPNDDTPRIFVLHRPALIGNQGFELLRKLTSAGFMIVTEFDDHPDHFQMMQLGGELSFRGVHAVQTSTAALAEVFRKYNPEVAVFPNALVSLNAPQNFVDPIARMTLFFGALNREADWRPLMPVLNRVAAIAGDRLGFQVVHDRAFFDFLDTPHKVFTPTCDYDTYLRILAGCEISFMPLGDNQFNRAKSDLKFIEAGSCRVASVSSNVVYGDSIDHGRNGLLFRDPEELCHCLLKLLALPELAKGLGEAARDTVKHHRMLAYQVAPRIAWYRSLWARREMLNVALRQRLAKPSRQAA